MYDQDNVPARIRQSSVRKEHAKKLKEDPYSAVDQSHQLLDSQRLCPLYEWIGTKSYSDCNDHVTSGNVPSLKSA